MRARYIQRLARHQRPRPKAHAPVHPTFLPGGPEWLHCLRITVRFINQPPWQARLRRIKCKWRTCEINITFSSLVQTVRPRPRGAGSAPGSPSPWPDTSTGGTTGRLQAPGCAAFRNSLQTVQCPEERPVGRGHPLPQVALRPPTLSPLPLPGCRTTGRPISRLVGCLISITFTFCSTRLVFFFKKARCFRIAFG